ncbi:GPI mannosyltransferase 3-like [Mya arenaria]|uniref:GPI mannosyltransferase 3-like n=1 Tax=Mya arenaria TaxID=6604 RepID=UPI0022E609CC|nr:GPI mannosyltransferase 3-like [Mya arenaria]
MTKDAKSAATIRRRKHRHRHGDLERFKSCRPSSPTPLEEINEFNEEDEGYLFDDEILGPSVVKKIMSSEKTLFLSLICIRIVNSLMIQTSFVPDEFWQSVEVSHRMVFGYGHLTWEWKNGLRGYLYPSVFAFFYKVFALLGLDSRQMMIKLPRIIQGIIAATGDLYLYKLSWMLCDRATAQWSLFCQMTNWFMLYSTTRTLTNSTETVLVTAALYYFPWPGKPSSSHSVRRFLLLASLSIIVRPTAAVIWILICSWHLQNCKNNLYRTVKTYIIVGVVSLGMSATIDRVFYGEWTFVQYNFLQFNVLGGGGSFYGTHPWHWYLTQGLPVVMGLHMAPFLMGIRRAKNFVPLFVIIWTIFIYSFLSHKEFRFLMPILPLTFHYGGVFFQSYCKKPKMKRKQIKRVYENVKNDNVRGSQESLVSNGDGSESNTTEISSEQSVLSTETSGIASEASLGTDTEVSKQNYPDEVGPKGTDEKTEHIVDNDDGDTMEGGKDIQEETRDMAKKRDLSANEIIAEMEKKQKESHKNNLTKAKVFVIIILLVNIPASMYFCLIHQRGTIYVMKYIHDASLQHNIDALFLMPCHSTPFYSYIHRNISMRFLTCEPNLQHKENYTDEADVFFNDPVSWLKTEYAGSSRPWPSHLVYFSPLQSDIELYLLQNGYKDCASFFHTHIPEGRVGSHVIVSCR